MVLIVFWVFFFKQKTAYEMRISDWTSDVCSSDLRILRRLLVLFEKSDELEHLGHRTARLLRPVPRTLRAYGQQHDRHFILGQSELAGHRFGIETDHRRRTQAQRAGCIDHRRRTEGAAAYCLNRKSGG